MIGRLYRGAIHFGSEPLARFGVDPNHVTLAALLCGLGACAVWLWRGDPLIFAVLLLLGGYLDTLDGAVARKTRRETRLGGYFDAVSDRIFDCAVMFSLAWRTSHWPICMLMAMAGFSVSYAKARAAMEVSVSNLGWPHLMGREERVIGLVLTLVAWGLLPEFRPAGFDLLTWGLAMMTAGMLITTVRRFLYARDLMLQAAERSVSTP